MPIDAFKATAFKIQSSEERSLHRDGAFYEARSRALAAQRRQRHDPYLARVRCEIARHARCDHVDTATRHLEADGRIRVWEKGQ